MLIVTHSPVAALPVKCSASLANKDAFWYDIKKVDVVAIKRAPSLCFLCFCYIAVLCFPLLPQFAVSYTELVEFSGRGWFRVWVLVLCEGQDPVFPGTVPTKLTLCRFQVHEQTRDERPWAVRSHNHHECRYFSLLPERRMVQISILPSILFLLPIWVSFYFLCLPSHLHLCFFFQLGSVYKRNFIDKNKYSADFSERKSTITIWFCFKTQLLIWSELLFWIRLTWKLQAFLLLSVI